MKVIFSSNFRPKTKKIVAVVFEINIKVFDFGLIWRPFLEYLQIKNLFQKSGSVCGFSTFIVPYLRAKKSEKSLEPFLTKLRNQPTNQLLPKTPRLTSVQKYDEDFCFSEKMHEISNIFWLSWTVQSNFQIFSNFKTTRHHVTYYFKAYLFYCNDELPA